MKSWATSLQGVGMTPMYVHVVQTMVSEEMYKQWCQAIRSGFMRTPRIKGTSEASAPVGKIEAIEHTLKRIS